MAAIGVGAIENCRAALKYLTELLGYAILTPLADP